MKLKPILTRGTIAALLLTAGLAACTDSTDLPTPPSLAPAGVTSTLAAKPGYTALPATRTSTDDTGLWLTDDKVTATIHFYGDAEGTNLLEGDNIQVLTYTANPADPNLGSWKADPAAVPIPREAKSMRVKYTSAGTPDDLSHTYETLTGYVSEATGTAVTGSPFTPTTDNNRLIPIAEVTGTLALSVDFERTSGLVSVLLQPGQAVVLSYSSGDDSNKVEVSAEVPAKATAPATAHFHVPITVTGTTATFTLSLKGETKTAYQDLPLHAGWKYTLDAGNIIGGSGGGDHQFVTADGMQPLDTKIFNEKNPVWLITGGGDATNATVIGYVKAALDALPPGTNNIELTLTGMKELPNDAFSGRTALATVSLPAATTIGNNAFAACTVLTAVSLPKATTIGDNAFNGCTALAAIDLPEATSVGAGAFRDCTALATASLPKATKISATIDGVGAGAFQDCTALTAIDLPAATTIGQDAFNGCTALASVKLPLATSIGQSAFSNCTTLTTLNLPAAKEINQAAFSGCTKLTTIYLPAATTIGNNAFWGCALTLLELTAPGAFTLANLGDFLSENCTLVLNPDKKSGTTGAGSPKVSADGTQWGINGSTPVTWKEIRYTGTSLPGVGDGGKPY